MNEKKDNVLENAEISEKNSLANEGETTNEVNLKPKTIINKNIWVPIAIIAVLVIIVIIYLCSSQNPQKQAVRLIEKDLGYSITCEKVYYSKENSACVVVFKHTGVEDTATVDLKSEEVGYQSVFNKVNNSYSSYDQKSAQIKYNAMTEAYDVFMAYNAISGKGDWKVIYENDKSN